LKSVKPVGLEKILVQIIKTLNDIKDGRKKMRFDVPLYLTIGKKNYWLNQNGYRNWHFHLSNKLKKTFKDTITLPNTKYKRSVQIAYTFYYPNAIKRDIGNSLAVIDKFTADALIENGNLLDDDFTVVKKIIGKFGGIDKDNPRCEVKVQEVR